MTRTDRAPAPPWPRDDHELERRRSARARLEHARASLPEGQRDETTVGNLVWLRTEHDWLTEIGLDAEHRIGRYRVSLPGVAILHDVELAALELTAEQLEAELLRDLGRSAQLRLHRMKRHEQNEAKKRAHAAALGKEIDQLVKRMTDPTLPPHRRREAHGDLRQLSPVRAAEFLELMEVDLARIEEHERIERRRVQAEQERKWAEGIPEARAEAERIRELGEKTLELEGQ